MVKTALSQNYKVIEGLNVHRSTCAANKDCQLDLATSSITLRISRHLLEASDENAMLTQS
jgi:hypothetical protein